MLCKFHEWVSLSNLLDSFNEDEYEINTVIENECDNDYRELYRSITESSD